MGNSYSLSHFLISLKIHILTTPINNTQDITTQETQKKYSEHFVFERLSYAHISITKSKALLNFDAAVYINVMNFHLKAFRIQVKYYVYVLYGQRPQSIDKQISKSFRLQSLMQYYRNLHFYIQCLLIHWLVFEESSFAIIITLIQTICLVLLTYIYLYFLLITRKSKIKAFVVTIITVFTN